MNYIKNVFVIGLVAISLFTANHAFADTDTSLVEEEIVVNAHVAVPYNGSATIKGIFFGLFGKKNFSVNNIRVLVDGMDVAYTASITPISRNEDHAFTSRMIVIEELNEFVFDRIRIVTVQFTVQRSEDDKIDVGSTHLESMTITQMEPSGLAIVPTANLVQEVQGLQSEVQYLQNLVRKLTELLSRLLFGIPSETVNPKPANILQLT